MHAQGVKKKSRARRVLFVASYLLFLFVVLEVAVRFYWVAKGTSFLGAPNELHRTWYPELDGIESSRDDETLDILLLGGSTMFLAQKTLEEELARRVAGPWRIHNGAMTAHTTWDSRYKYKHLADQRFDLVVVYHGINDVRANNCPPEMFRDDYGHYSWYRRVLPYESGSDRWVVLPLTLRYIVDRVGPRWGLVDVMPTSEPPAPWLHHAAEVRSRAPFRANLEWIADRARERGDPLVMLTFAIHVDPNYTDEDFLAGKLAYQPPLAQAISVWGDHEHVRSGVLVHNEVTRDVARRENMQLVEMIDAVPREARYWRDVCHFTPEGKRVWAQALVSALRDQNLIPGR
ncbi:MAG: hypothetical protein AAGD14_11350 [Planctomycetota bacterium]